MAFFLRYCNLCYKLGDQISQEIEKTPNIREENVVEVVDKAIGKVKRDLASAQSSENCEESQKTEEPVNPDKFI